MWLIVVYVGFIIAGDFADYLVGVVAEDIWPGSSLTVFLVLYFFVLWAAWRLAVRVTEPKTATAA